MYLSRNIPFTNISLQEILDETFNWNCLSNKKEVKSGKGFSEILKLKEQSFHESEKYKQSDPDENVVYPKEFSFHNTHEFREMKNKLEKHKQNLRILYSNIHSLQGNSIKLELQIKTLDYIFDVTSLTETWQLENNKILAAKKLKDYHKRKGISGATKKRLWILHHRFNSV